MPPTAVDHTISPRLRQDQDPRNSSSAVCFGLEYNGTWGHFAPVKVNDTLTLDFDDSDDPRSNHYAFLASDDEFDTVLQRVKDEGIAPSERQNANRTRRQDKSLSAPGTRVSDLPTAENGLRVGGHHPYSMSLSKTLSVRKDHSFSTRSGLRLTRPSLNVNSCRYDVCAVFAANPIGASPEMRLSKACSNW